jgi:hypothetical protein
MRLKRFLGAVKKLLGALAVASARITHFAAQSPTPFVPDDFQIPAGLETAEFRLRMLTVNDVVKDFEAVVTSAEHLKQVFPGGTWPDGLTLEQDLIDLGWHQKEFQRRTSFAYTVATPSESRVLGCVYVCPTPKRGYDAAVFLWARQSELAGGLEERLTGAVKQWIAKEWPFRSVAYPGRGIFWEDYEKLPSEKR